MEKVKKKYKNTSYADIKLNTIRTQAGKTYCQAVMGDMGDGMYRSVAGTYAKN